MAQLSDDCFAFGGALMPLAEAIRLIETRIAPVTGEETVDLSGADGRVLAEDIEAPLDLPPFDNSAVDGYAVSFSDLAPAGETRLPVEGRIAAGGSAPTDPGHGRAVRVFTGAALPPALDTVFMQEDVRVERGMALLPAGLARGANRRAAGEDIARGAVALPAGRRLTPRDIALLAALGLMQIPVRARLRVGVLSTGDEVVAPGEELRPGKLHDANRPMLLAMLARLGCAPADLGIAPDDRSALAARLAEAAASVDLIITSGGVSTGEEDHVRAAIEAAGSLTFWRIAIKPGRPVALGTVVGTPLIGLPGNPAAAYVTFVRVARILIARLAGEAYAPPLPIPVRLGFAHRKREGRREYVRARLVAGPDGPVAHKHPREGAGIVTSLTETDGLLEFPEEATRCAVGDAIPFLPHAALT